MRQQPDDELCPLTPGVLLGFDEGLQVPEDAQRVADLSDPERVTRRHPAVLVAGVENRPPSVIGVGLEDEAFGLEANPSHGTRWRHGGDARRVAERQRIDVQNVSAYRQRSARRSDQLGYGIIGLGTRDQAGLLA